MSSSDPFDALREVCEVAVSTGVVPGAVVLCAEGGTTRFHQAFGARQLEPTPAPAVPGTIYDVASVTKAVVTSVLAMRAVANGELALEDPVARHQPQFQGAGKDAVTIRHLLCHASGLPAHRPFYAPFVGHHRDARAVPDDVRARRDAIIAAAASEPLERPPGQRAVYSDLGFMLLGDVLERRAGNDLAVMTDHWLVPRLGLGATTFVRTDGAGARTPVLAGVAPTERCAEREALVSGEVHDLNAYAIGGVAGALVAAWHGDVTEPIVPKDVIRAFWEPAGVSGATWRLGWDGPAEQGSQAGTRLSRRAVGHLGFTGCSLWIDPPRRLWIVVLTNRVHPVVRDDPRFKVFRPAVHDAAMLGLDG
jgi:CubicO group peptidase (beta-lactamase class C family)